MKKYLLKKIADLNSLILFYEKNGIQNRALLNAFNELKAAYILQLKEITIDELSTKQKIKIFINQLLNKFKK